MSEQTVAFRYAKSLLDLAKEKNVVKDVYNDMKFFDSVVEENRQLLLVLKSPIVKHFTKLTVLKEIFKDKVSPATWSIMEIITKKNREEILPAIAESYQIQYAEMMQVQKATVLSAVTLTDTQRTQLKAQITQLTGRSEVELDEKTDTSLIGGYVLRIGDRQIDTSVRKKLNDLKVSMLS